jgi:hypothetical protein
MARQVGPTKSSPANTGLMSEGLLDSLNPSEDPVLNLETNPETTAQRRTVRKLAGALDIEPTELVNGDCPPKRKV